MQKRQNYENGTRRQISRNERSARVRRTSPDPPPTHHSRAADDRSPMLTHHYRRDASDSPPPPLTYSYPLPDPVITGPYPQRSPYHSLSAPYSDYSGQQVYLPPVTLPSMSPYELGSTKNHSFFDGEDMLSPFSMSYSPMTSLDIQNTQHYQESDPNVNISYFHYQS